LHSRLGTNEGTFLSFKRGELVIYKNQLYKVYSDVSLNGTIRIRLAGQSGVYHRVFARNLIKATALMRELL
jgi:hypothetical protein